MKEPRVKDIITIYQKDNLKGVHEYLIHPDMTVDPSTWSGNIKSLIENKHFQTAKEIIELTAYKFLKL